LFRCIAACLCALGLLLPKAAAAQTSSSDPSENARFQYGALRFTPFLAITEIGVDTNVFNDAQEPQRDTTATFGPGAEYWVRAGRARISAKSDVQYNWFRDFANQRSLSTNNDLKIEFPMARVTPFVDGVFDHGRVRPGYEIDTRAFRTDSGGGGGIDVDITPKTGVRLETHRRRLKYREDEFFFGNSLQETLNRRTDSVGVSWRQKLTPLTTLVVLSEYEKERFDFQSSRDAKGVRVMPGFEFDPFAVIGGKVFVGFRSFDTTDPLLPNYSGVVADVEANYRTRSTRFDIRVQRDVDYSAEELEPYYLLTDAGVKVTQKITQRWDMVGTVSRQWLDYQRIEGLAVSNVPSHADHSYRVGGGVGYLLGSSVRVGVDVAYYQRNSPLAAREYDGLRVGGSFTYGLTRQ
jgi:putative beta-barrel porin BBP2